MRKSFGDRIEGKEQFILFKKIKVPVGWQYLTIDILLEKAALLNQSSGNFSFIWMFFFYLEKPSERYFEDADIICINIFETLKTIFII